MSKVNEAGALARLDRWTDVKSEMEVNRKSRIPTHFSGCILVWEISCKIPFNNSYSVGSPFTPLGRHSR